MNNARGAQMLFLMSRRSDLGRTTDASLIMYSTDDCQCMRKEKVTIVHAVIICNGPVQIPRPSQRSHDYRYPYNSDYFKTAVRDHQIHPLMSMLLYKQLPMVCKSESSGDHDFYIPKGSCPSARIDSTSGNRGSTTSFLPSV